MFLGFDPSVHASAIAVVGSNENDQPILLGGWICHGDERLQDRIAVVDQIECLNRFFITEFPFAWRSQIKAYMVESQELTYTTKQGGNVRDVALLGPVSGCALTMSLGLFPNALPKFPAPSDWKGNKPKYIDQAQTYSRLRVSCKKHGKTGKSAYQEPLGLPPFEGSYSVTSVTHWKDLGDAIGMAVRVREKYLLCEKIVAARQAGNMNLAWQVS